jgi:hypothetical protein
MASNDGSFDVSARWVILAPFPAIEAVADLARCIALLRKQSGLEEVAPAIEDASGPAPDDTVPVIVLNTLDKSDESGGYTWRTAATRVEIYGDSRRGLCNGIYDFLANLGFQWPGPYAEILPKGTAAIYPLKAPSAYQVSNAAPEARRRLIIPSKARTKEILALGRWAMRNHVDALVFSLGNHRITGSKTVVELQDRWALIIERGGWDLSLLAPRRRFPFNRELFRMEGGKRMRDHHFCPTNPDTIVLLQHQMQNFLEHQEKHGRPAKGLRRIYHLWPDQGAEQIWCACPACRAFNPREQIRLAVNAAAATIAAQDPQALISCRGEEDTEQLPGGSELTLRPNVFRLSADAAVYFCEGGTIREI